MPHGRFEHVVCVYPYRRDLSKFACVPPLGLEYIAAVIEPHAKALEIVDLRKDLGRTKDFLRPETDCVCFSVNWDRDADFLREEILSVPPRLLTVVGSRHASENPGHWLTLCPNVAIVVRGDGEEAMEEICRGVPLEEIAGISFRRDGQIIHIIYRRTGVSTPTKSHSRRFTSCGGRSIRSSTLQRRCSGWHAKGSGTGYMRSCPPSRRGCRWSLRAWCYRGIGRAGGAPKFHERHPGKPLATNGFSGKQAPFQRCVSWQD